MAERTGLIKAIHAGRKALGLSEDEYRAYLLGATKKDSLREMTDAQLTLVMMRMRGDGFGQKAEQKQIQYVRSLWLKLYDAGAIKRKEWAAMDAYVAKMLQMDVKVNDLNARELSKVIEHLKAWSARVGLA